jgi:transcriptional regulator with XRE-family HTH domain
MRFGANLARHRRAAGLSQELLGDLADLHRTAIGQIERVARSDTLLKLAVALRIDPAFPLRGHHLDAAPARQWPLRISRGH